MRVAPILRQHVKARSEAIDWSAAAKSQTEVSAAAKLLKADFERYALAEFEPGFVLSRMFGSGDPPPDLSGVRVSVALGLLEALDDTEGHTNDFELPLDEFWQHIRIRARDEF